MANYQLSGICNKDNEGTSDPGGGGGSVVSQCSCVVIDGTDVIIDNGEDSVVINSNTTLASLIDNGDGSYTFNDGTGNITTFDINEINMDVNDITITDSVITFTSEDGITVNADICAIAVSYTHLTLPTKA